MSKTTKKAVGSLLVNMPGIIIDFATSGHQFWSVTLVFLGIVATICIFWKEITSLRITHPKNTVPEKPGWLYLLGFALLAISACQAWKLYNDGRNVPNAVSPEVFASSYVSGQYIRLQDFAVNGVIEDRTFENDHIYGPAVAALSPTGMVEIGNDIFHADGESAFVAVDTSISPRIPDTGKSGVITLRNVRIIKCTITGVTFIGTPDDVIRWRNSNTKAP